MTVARERSIRDTPRWVTLLLVLSLAANLGVLGLFGGAVIGVRDADEDQARRLPFLLRVMPESRHDEARALLEESRSEREALEQGREAADAELIAAMCADPFDPARLEAAFATRREASAERRGLIRGHILELADRMSAPERAEMADRTEQMLRHWRERRAAREANAAQRSD